MDISAKVSILTTLYMSEERYASWERDDVVDFCRVYNVELALAWGVEYGRATLTPLGVNDIERTWTALCTLFDLDPDGDYLSLEEIVDEP